MLPKIHGSLEKIFTLDGSYLNKSIGEVGLSTNKQFGFFFLANTYNKKLNDNSLTCRAIVHGRTAVNVSMTLAPLILLKKIQSTC